MARQENKISPSELNKLQSLLSITHMHIQKLKVIWENPGCKDVSIFGMCAVNLPQKCTDLSRLQLSLSQ